MEHADSSSRESPFELSAGSPCLDFANTWSNRSRPESDRLRSYDDVLAFAGQAGLIPDQQAQRLAERARRRSAEAEPALQRALELREALDRLFRAAAGGEEPPEAELRRLNEFLRDALCCLGVERRDDGYAWGWADRDEALDVPVWRLAHAAAELLTSDELDRVRACAGATCTWLFLDRSRNRSRRWCDMAVCGNRAKARRHYRRTREASRDATPAR